MATTPNYGWVTPAPTDFVTDLPADFEVFADAVDADLGGLLGGTTGQVLAKDSNADHDFSWVTPESSPITTEGDLIIGDATGDPVRLPIGSAGHVLTSDGDTADWAAITVAGKSYTLLNTGNTAISGSTTFTVSGISGIDDFLILIGGAVAGASSNITIRFNSDMGSNYGQFGTYAQWTSSYNSNNFSVLTGNNNAINIGNASASSSSAISGSVRLSGGRSTNPKIFQAMGGGTPFGGTASQIFYWFGGAYVGTSAISSVSIVSSSGNFVAGDLFIYGAA